MSAAGTSASLPRVSSRTSVSTIRRESVPSIPRTRDARRGEDTHGGVVSAAGVHRRLLVFGALTLYAATFTAFVVFEVPGLGIGHFFYIPVAMVALANGARIGILGGLLAAGLYALGVVVVPSIPAHQVLTAGTAIRIVTYSAVGCLIGW